MDIKLNIYKRDKIVKTYSTKSLYITTGTVEKIFKETDVDKLLAENTTQEKVGREILKICVKGFPNFKDTILDIFEGMTEEEWGNTHIDEIARVIFLILQNALASLNGINVNEKN